MVFLTQLIITFATARDLDDQLLFQLICGLGILSKSMVSTTACQINKELGIGSGRIPGQINGINLFDLI
jgi:hypothetical protein